MRVNVVNAGIVLGLALGLACGDEEPEPGTEGGPCWGGEFCPEPLVCGSGHCVLPPELEGTETEDGAAEGDGPPIPGDDDAGADGNGEGEDDGTDPNPNGVDCPSACSNFISIAAQCWDEILDEAYYEDVCIPDCEGGHDELTFECATMWTGSCPGLCSFQTCAEHFGINCSSGTTGDGGTGEGDGGTGEGDGGTGGGDGGTEG